MSHPQAHPLPWSTACSATPPDISSADLQGLHVHLTQCGRQGTSIYLWRCMGHELVGLVTARLLTTTLLLMTFVLLLQAL